LRHQLSSLKEQLRRIFYTNGRLRPAPLATLQEIVDSLPSQPLRTMELNPDEHTS